MNTVLKYLTYAISGISILTVSFLGFAVMSGTPMNEMAGIGKFFPQPEEAEEVADKEQPDLEHELAGDDRSAEQMLDESTSPLQAFMLPSGFSATELEELEKALQTRMAELDQRERALDEREEELLETDRHYQDLYGRLEGLRNSVLEEEAEVSAQKEEAARDRLAAEEREALSYKKMAGIFQEGKASDSARLLIDVYDPTEAARILGALEEERAGQILAAIHSLAPERSKAYHQAFRTQ